MATDYSTMPAVQISEVFGGRLEKYGIREIIKADTTETLRYLTDGEYEHCFCAWGGGISWSRSHGPIVGAICEEFEVDEIISDQDPQFWGFETWEEIEARIQEVEQEEKREFLQNLRGCLRGEPNAYAPATFIMHRKLELACELAQEDPGLTDNDVLLWARLDNAWNKVLAQDRRKHPVWEDDLIDF